MERKGFHVCLSKRKNRKHGLLAGSVGAASNPPLSRACAGDNVDNEGGFWPRVQCTWTHKHTGEAPHPGPGEPN